MPYTTLVSGTTITASWANGSVRDQTIAPFATASARTSAISSPVEGMLSYRTDGKVFEGYDGTGWNGAIPTNVIARKTSDQSVNNTTTLASDTALQWSVVASAVYMINLRIMYSSGTVPDFKLGWSVPSGTTMNWFFLGNDTSLAVVNAGNYDQTSTPALGGSGADLWALIGGLVTVSSTAGTLILQFAQSTANASNSTMRAGSHGTLTRLA